LGLSALAIFVRHELTTPEPMLALRTFSIRGFRLASIITAMLVASQFIRVVYVPSELEVFRDFTALRVGVLLTPAAIASGIAMQFGGRMVDRFGPRVPVTIGSFLVAVGTFALSRFTLTTSGLEIALLLCVQGIGFGLAIVPTTVATVNSVRPNLLGQATAIRAVTQQVASAVAVAAAGALISVLTPVHPTPAEAQHAFSQTYAIAATLGMFAFVSAFGLARRPGSTAEPSLFTE
jgi:MFS family permease